MSPPYAWLPTDFASMITSAFWRAFGWFPPDDKVPHPDMMALKEMRIKTFHLFLFFYRYAALYISDAGLSKSKSEESMERCLLSSLITECDQIIMW